MAYNAGRRGRADGLSWEYFVESGLAASPPDLTIAERRTLISRGPAFFSRWALRGYFEP